MRHNCAWLASAILVGLLITGCRSTPAPTLTVIPFPTFTATPVNTPTPDAVAVDVEEANQQSGGQVKIQIQSATNPRLPAPLYFLGENHQIWRLDQDGLTAIQITSEQAAISAFDYSPVHGRMVYVTDDGGLLVEYDPATDQRVIKVVHEPSADLPADFADFAKLDSPRYSPDGTRISFAHNGIYLMESGLQAVGEAVLLQANVYPEGQALNNVDKLRTYRATRWSPAGDYLLLWVGLWESNGYELYNLQRQTLTPMNRPDQNDYISALDIDAWSWGRDEQSGYIASTDMRGYGPGLFHVDRAQAVTTHLSTTLPSTQDTAFPTGMIPRGVYETPDGVLQLFLSMQDSLDRYQLYRLAPNAPPTLLNETAVEIAGEVLWAADGSGALVVTERLFEEGEPPLGPITWIALNGEVDVLPIRGHQLRWGKNPRVTTSSPVQALAYVRAGQLFLATYPDLAATAVDRCPGEASCFSDLSWSPQGTQLLYLKSTYTDSMGLSAIYLVDTQEQRPHLLATGRDRQALAMPVWSPDSKQLAYGRGTEEALSFFPPQAEVDNGQLSDSLRERVELWLTNCIALRKSSDAAPRASGPCIGCYT